MKKAALGMGTLIVFIAIILSVSAAASVIIVVSGKYQSKALKTGKETEGEVGTLMKFSEVYAHDGSDSAIDRFYATVRLSAGSDPMKFENALLQFGLKNISSAYLYNSSVDCAGAIIASNETFGIEYQKKGKKYVEGYISKGDMVKICFLSPRNITIEEKYKISVVPSRGSVAFVESVTPSLFFTDRVHLYP